MELKKQKSKGRGGYDLDYRKMSVEELERTLAQQMD